MSKTPARLIVEAFGNCEALADMYTDDVVWRLNYSLPANIAGPHIGKAAVTAFNDAVFNKIYDGGNMQINIHDEIGNKQSSVVRFDIHATSRRGNSYDVEYVLFAKQKMARFARSQSFWILLRRRSNIRVILSGCPQLARIGALYLSR